MPKVAVRSPTRYASRDFAPILANKQGRPVSQVRKEVDPTSLHPSSPAPTLRSTPQSMPARYPLPPEAGCWVITFCWTHRIAWELPLPEEGGPRTGHRIVFQKPHFRHQELRSRELDSKPTMVTLGVSTLPPAMWAMTPEGRSRPVIASLSLHSDIASALLQPPSPSSGGGYSMRSG
jgi:hypothetical protein